MKCNKNLRFCLDKLDSLQKRGEFEPEQTSKLERAKRKLKRLWRKANPAKAEIFYVVRQVAEAISDAIESQKQSSN